MLTLIDKALRWIYFNFYTTLWCFIEPDRGFAKKDERFVIERIENDGAF